MKLTCRHRPAGHTTHSYQMCDEINTFIMFQLISSHFFSLSHFPSFADDCRSHRWLQNNCKWEKFSHQPHNLNENEKKNERNKMRERTKRHLKCNADVPFVVAQINDYYYCICHSQVLAVFHRKHLTNQKEGKREKSLYKTNNSSWMIKNYDEYS